MDSSSIQSDGVVWRFTAVLLLGRPEALKRDGEVDFGPRGSVISGVQRMELPEQRVKYGLQKATAMRNTVLIADDNAFIRTALYEIFEREPDFHVCAVVENGREAIEEACRLQPDLIVLDLAMPVMNGLDAARVLRQMMPDVPIIIYSSTPNEVSQQAALSIGISGLISKSDRVSVLIETVRGALHRKAA